MSAGLLTRKLLSQSEIDQQLEKLKHWKQVDSSLVSDFKFQNFVDAFGFMTQVALEAEKIDHHPDWSNSYNKVKISLTTYSSGGISQLDIALATQINNLYQSDA